MYTIIPRNFHTSDSMIVISNCCHFSLRDHFLNTEIETEKLHLQRSKQSCRDCMLPDMHHLQTRQRLSLHFHVPPVLQYIQSRQSCCSRWKSFHQNLLRPEICRMATNSHSVPSAGVLPPAQFYTPNDCHLHMFTDK